MGIEFIANRDMNKLIRDQVKVYRIVVRRPDDSDESFRVRADWIHANGEGKVSVFSTKYSSLSDEVYEYRFTHEYTAFAFKMRWATSV